MISLLLPTRGRPALARRFLDSVADRAARPDEIEVILYVNDDDVESHRIDHPRLHVVLLIGSDGTMGEFNTRCLAKARGSIVALVNDDIVVRSDGWDETLRRLNDRFPDEIYLAYPNDLFKGQRLATFPIMTRRVCELLESPYPVEYRGALIDYHLLDVFKRLKTLGHDRTCYLNDVVFEHMHHRTGKGAIDETYRRRARFGDDAVFVALRDQRQTAAIRLAASIEGRPLPSLAPAATLSSARSWVPAAADYARMFLGDGNLPLPWRTYLFAWYCGRHLAAHGLRRPGSAA
jgi:hypothetical protein